MPARIYERLSQVYDLDWGMFAVQFVPLVNKLLSERGILQARILDLACGTGTLAVELAKQGHWVHGLDASLQMIEIAQSKATGLPNVQFDVQDMATFQVEGTFHLVTCSFDSINYLLSVDAVGAMLHRVAAVLRNPGVFAFDSNTERMYARHHGETYSRELGGQPFVHTVTYNRVTREAIITFEFADGATEVHRQRPYGLSELRGLLVDAGLCVVHAWSGFDRKTYSTESERLICVAEMRATSTRTPEP